ncbi:endonuclease domain-containing protein [Shimazuella sp. AN120528]|uniref:endonuclease domain-containing protein n=1 Tax=Shimazuella soli TaxID=1892854 RepID=UPI001F0F55B0|nr:DUF559 domain-containing protein [Shimazuella soli]MCH5584078.1 endonuclease domain-containing protein [Shimazuella soli]
MNKESKVYKKYRVIRRKYIEFKRSVKSKMKIPFYPFLAVRFLYEQWKLGHAPSLDMLMFQTDSPLERMLYYELRYFYKGQIAPQHPLGPYWIDFAIPKHKLALECDGYPYHSSEKARLHDRNRDAYMKRVGWKVMRFTYKDLCKENIAQTMQQIHDYTMRATPKQKKAN